MKKTAFLAVAAIISMFTCSGICAEPEGDKAAPVALKIGFVDVFYVIENSKAWKQARAELDIQLKDVNSRLEELEKEIRKMQARSEMMRTGPEKEELDKEIIMMKYEAAELSIELETQIEEKTLEAIVAVYLLVDREVAAYAKAEGYGLVFRISREQDNWRAAPNVEAFMRLIQGSPLVYYDRESEVTDAVLDRVNEVSLEDARAHYDEVRRKKLEEAEKEAGGDGTPPENGAEGPEE